MLLDSIWFRGASGEAVLRPTLSRSASPKALSIFPVAQVAQLRLPSKCVSGCNATPYMILLFGTYEEIAIT
jgi:hypothetical protein